jgi:murein DD-endopeptidase MepM/ murein hydrolase activator NlpD
MIKIILKNIFLCVVVFFYSYNNNSIAKDLEVKSDTKTSIKEEDVVVSSSKRSISKPEVKVDIKEALKNNTEVNDPKSYDEPKPNNDPKSDSFKHDNSIQKNSIDDESNVFNKKNNSNKTSKEVNQTEDKDSNNLYDHRLDKSQQEIISENPENIKSTEVYVVQEKDTIYGISKKFNISTSKIIEDNGLSSSGVIKIGQKLKLNQNPSQKNNSTDQLKADEQQSKGFSNYKIAQGDTLYSLSKKYNVKISDIQKINNFNDSFLLKIGYVIKIPISENSHLTSGSDDVSQDNKNQQNVLIQVQNSDKKEVQKPTLQSEDQKKEEKKPISPIASNTDINLKQNQTTTSTTTNLNSINFSKQQEKILNKDVSKTKPEQNQVSESSKNNTLCDKQTKMQGYARPIHTKIISDASTKLDNKGIYNNGILFKVNGSMLIVASNDGVVVFASYLKNYHNVVMIKHCDGKVSIYANLDKILVKNTQRIAKNQKIAIVSESLSKPFYFSIRDLKNGQKTLNPLDLFEN